MARLETVVRPFATKDVSPPQRYVAAGQQANPPVLLQWGRGGRGRVFNGSYSLSKSYYCDQHINEKSTP